jgi:hypothetical protein
MISRCDFTREDLQNRLALLRAINRRAKSKKRSPSWRRIYWRRVLTTARRCGRCSNSSDLISCLCNNRDVQPTVPHFIDAILRATLSGDRRARYKYAALLKLALTQDVSQRDLISFVKTNGGVNGCVDLFRKRKVRKEIRSMEKPRRERNWRRHSSNNSLSS